MTALEQNSNHVGSLLLLADYSIDAEDYREAEKLLSRVDSVNPAHPEAWAYRAVLAHLQNQPDVESMAREQALKFHATNPRVDYLIGLKLSQKYRFAEGAVSQRRAKHLVPCLGLDECAFVHHKVVQALTAQTIRVVGAAHLHRAARRE